MEMNFTKAAIAAAALSLTSVAYAAGFAPPAEVKPAASVPVTIPVQFDGWHVAATFFWVQPANDDLEFARVSVTSGTTTTQQLYAVDPDYAIGYKLEGTYYIDSTGNDLSLHWTHMHTSDEDTVTDATNNVLVPATNNTTFDMAKGVGKFDFDTVALEFGQHIDVGERLDVRVHGGVQYARLDSKLRVETNDVTDATTYDISEATSEWQGAGLRFGGDASFELGRNFSAVGSAAISILAGRIEAKVDHTDVNAGVINARQIRHSVNERVIVPTGEAKLGLAYSHDINKDATVSIEAGWQFATYLDVVRHEVNNAVDGFSDPKSNFGMHGPYGTVKYRT